MFASQGVDTAGLLDAAGIDPAALEQPHGRFDLQQVNALWELAVAASAQETLGLERELAALFINFETAAQTMASAPNLLMALESLSQYLALTDDAAAFTLERDHPNAWMVLTHGNDPAFPRQRLEYAMLVMVLVCQRATRRALRPLAADFVFPEPADAHRHRMAFPCPLRFDRPTNRLLFAAEDLALPVAAGSASVFLLEERVLETLLAALGTARTSFRVSQEMVRRLLRGGLDASSVPASIGLTEPDMTRQLRAERTSVDELLDRARREIAHEYLAGSQYPLAGMAALLGLQDDVEFVAACRRWFDASPADYRLHHGAGG